MATRYYCAVMISIPQPEESCINQPDQAPPLCQGVCFKESNESYYLVDRLRNDPRLASLIEALLWFFDLEGADQWLMSPCDSLDGDIPIEVIDFGDYQDVEHAISTMIERDYFKNLK